MDVTVAIVGTGFSGMGAAIALDRAGISDYVLLEKAADLGGTWRDNTYPGAACDVPSHLYSFSFEPNPTWTRAYSPQPEILGYLRHVAQKYDLHGRIKLNARVVRADLDEERGVWRITLGNGETVVARALVLGAGALHEPSYPSIHGRESFAGPTLHSARWDHGIALAGKKVAVIGTGASAIQIVPSIAPIVGKLEIFQRHAPWILPRPDHAYSEGKKTLFSRVPATEWLHRARLYWLHELRAVGFFGPRAIGDVAQGMARRHLAHQVPDLELRKKLTPDYRMGCKRVLVSNDYYPALLRDNVELITGGIERIEPEGLRDKDGVLHPADVLVYATGFDILGHMTHIDVRGKGGVKIGDAWGNRPLTYLGITTHGFPNLYMLTGPNTGLGHNSMIFMIEAQTRYAAQAIKTLVERDVRFIDVKAEAQARFGDEVTARHHDSIWQTGGCKSWYQGPGGDNIALWPGFSAEYWLRTRKLELEDYDLA